VYPQLTSPHLEVMLAYILIFKIIFILFPAFTKTSDHFSSLSLCTMVKIVDYDLSSDDENSTQQAPVIEASKVKLF
jgi:hypothetical protein